MAWLFFVGYGSLLSAGHGSHDSAPLSVDPGELLKRVRGKQHPYLFFQSIKDTPGWKNRDHNPWGGRLGWAYYIKTAADRKESAAALALGYQLTGEERYARGAIEKLETVSTKLERVDYIRGAGEQLISLALAYDWVQPAMKASEDQRIRSILAARAAALCHWYPTQQNAHDRIIACCGLGTTGLALADWEGPTESGPVDWVRRGTMDLFVDDSFSWPETFHRPRPALCGVCNPGGFCKLGGYRAYWLTSFVRWLLVYRAATARNPLEDFPIARGIIDDPIAFSMPTRMDSQQDTRSQNYWGYGKAVLHLLNPQERGAFAWYEQDPGVDANRWRYTTGTIPGSLLFCVYRDNLPSASPTWTSFFSPSSESCVLRGSWRADADWLFFKCFNYPVPSHRCMIHNDNMSFELYSHGDYLLSDGGEVRGRMTGYGPEYASGHNTLLVDGRGPVKEDIEKEYFRFVDSARFTNHCLEPWLEFVEARMEVTAVELDPTKAIVGRARGSSEAGRGDRNALPLPAPVTWRRAILYPGKEYFLLVDSVASAAPHTYEFLFQFSSFDNESGTGRDKPGHVTGRLTVGGTDVDWAAGVRTDILTGAKPIREVGRYAGLARVSWATKNLWGEDVVLDLIPSIDADRVTVRRGWGRVAQVKKEDIYASTELDHPFAGFVHGGREVRRIMAILVRHAREPRWATARLPVSGEGNALRIEHESAVDFIAVGRGRLRVAGIATDARICFLRLRAGRPASALVVGGTILRFQGRELFSAAGLSHVALDYGRRSRRRLELHVTSAKGGATLRVHCSFAVHSASCAGERPDWRWGARPHPLTRAPEPYAFRQEGDAVHLELPPGSATITFSGE